MRQQLRVQRRPFGNEVGFARPGQLEQPFPCQLTIRELVHDALHVQHADDVLELLFVHRHPRVRTRADLFEDVVPAVGDIDRRDFAAGYHDVVDGDAFQIQNAEQHPLMSVRNHRARFGHDGTQLFRAERMRCGLFRGNSQQPQHAVREQVRDPDERIRDFHQCGIDIRRRQRELLRVQRSVGLGRHFAEDQQYDREQQRANRDRWLAAYVQRYHRNE